ncbi:ATP-binding cassette domain-containing protein [Gammaproteobacteria bacterium]|jgi:putative ABC transport system ATP-binding protein|nr:ATP-binding cassette domain-containing protein [Gammaproteobacteria bacterium]
MPKSIIEVQQLEFAWESEQTPVLSIASFKVLEQERIFIKGPSGCGKSTLLGLLGGVMLPQSGEIRILDQSLIGLSRGDRDRFRGDHIGFVFQMFNLIPYLSVIDNVTLPCRFSERRRRRAAAQSTVENEAQRLLDHLGLTDNTIKAKAATDLSVGQQQRVAVARALIGSPEIIIADEPTSALDTDLRDAFIRLLMADCNTNGTTLLFVSHDGGLSPHFDRVIDFGHINRSTH